MRVLSITRVPIEVPVVDIEVQGTHNFYVKAKNSSSLLRVHNCHSAAADCFSTVAGKFKTRYRFGVTGTVKRKDGRQFIIKSVYGPVRARTEVAALKPKVYVHETGAKFRSQPKHPTYAFLAISKNKNRNKLIVEHAIKDLKAGHSIIIPLTFKKHIEEIVFQINAAWGSEIAKHFVGGGTKKNKEERRQTLADAKSGKIRVVVGIRRLMQRGLNVKLWSCYYCCSPISNEPNLKQEVNRICTPDEGKLAPIARIFYERTMGISFGCARNTVEHLKGFGFRFSKSKTTQECLAELSASRGRRNAEDELDAEFKAVTIDYDERPERKSKSHSISDDDSPLMRRGRRW